MLTERERAQAAAQVRALIVASGQTGRLLRAQDGERLFGTDETGFVELCSVALELITAPPVDLGGKIDATASVLPEADARAEDRIEIADATYRIQTVRPQILFGVLTHQTLELVRLYER